MRILVVDDDQGILNALKVGLIGFGYRVVTARNGSQALKAVESSLQGSESIALMVADLRMPGMDGMKTIRSARELSPGLPAVLITAYGSHHIKREVEALGSCRYLEKPFTPEMLQRTIEELSKGICNE